MRKYVKSTKLNDPDALSLVEMELRKRGSDYFEVLTRVVDGLKITIIVGRQLPGSDGAFHTTHALILLGQDIENSKESTTKRLRIFDDYRARVLESMRLGETEGSGREVAHFHVYRVWESLQELQCIAFEHFNKFYMAMVRFEDQMEEEGWL